MSEDDALESLSVRLRDVQLHLALLKSEEVALKAMIREKIGDARGEVTAFGKPVIKVTYGKRFNAEHAEQVLSAYPDLLALVSRRVVDSTLARTFLPPGVYQQCQKEAAEPTIQPVVAA